MVKAPRLQVSSLPHQLKIHTVKDLHLVLLLTHMVKHLDKILMAKRLAVTLGLSKVKTHTEHRTLMALLSRTTAVILLVLLKVAILLNSNMLKRLTINRLIQEVEDFHMYTVRVSSRLGLRTVTFKNFKL